jgi:hypothetical protein
MYSLYLYFLGLSLRNTSKALVIFRDEKKGYASQHLEIIAQVKLIQILERIPYCNSKNGTCCNLGKDCSITTLYFKLLRINA